MNKKTQDDEVASAAKLLHAGKLVAFPTETVYGLGGNALSDASVAAIYAAKNRPEFNPLIVHIPSIAEAKKYVREDERAQILAEKFWENDGAGSLTFVLPRLENCALSLLVSAGMDTVAIRKPAHPLALALLEKSGLPLAAPSANKSGKISPTLASHVVEELGDKVAMVLDGGACAVGIESTIIDLSTTPATILRHGKITREELAKYIEIADYNGSEIKSAGMMQSHYAPNAKLRLNARDLQDGEALLAFGDVSELSLRAQRSNPEKSNISWIASSATPPRNDELQTFFLIQNLSESKDLEEAAANLFKMLRVLDASGVEKIAVMPIPMVGIGIAINDRLNRAAAPRNIVV
jgi:L-threonylcarbamoyladenylate synthase